MVRLALFRWYKRFMAYRNRVHSRKRMEANENYRKSRHLTTPAYDRYVEERFK